MPYQVNGRTVKHDPTEVIRCSECGQSKSRFAEHGMQQYKDYDQPTVCMECQRKNRRVAKSKRHQEKVVKEGGEQKQSKTSFFLDNYHRHALDALSYKFQENQKVVVQRALDVLIANLPEKDRKEVHLLISIRHGADEGSSSVEPVEVKE